MERYKSKIRIANAREPFVLLKERLRQLFSDDYSHNELYKLIMFTDSYHDFKSKRWKIRTDSAPDGASYVLFLDSYFMSDMLSATIGSDAANYYGTRISYTQCNSSR